MLRASFVLALAATIGACGGDDSTSGGSAGTGAQAAGTMSQGSGGSGGGSSGGAAGTSAAGSSMTGGAAGTSARSAGSSGSSAADGGPTCTVLNPNMCDTCVFAKCCEAYAACELDDDCQNAVGNLAECVANDPSMASQCYDDFASTNDKASTLRACVKSSCDALCTSMTP
jgi:hypothetical protein